MRNRRWSVRALAESNTVTAAGEPPATSHVPERQIYSQNIKGIALKVSHPNYKQYIKRLDKVIKKKSTRLYIK